MATDSVPAHLAAVVEDEGVRPALEAWDVSKRFGYRIVLGGVDMRVLPGRTLAVIGPNGAGKTTLLRILATLARPTAGVVRVAGVDAFADPVAARRQLGVMLGSSFLYRELSGAENLWHYARLYGVAEPERRIEQLARLVGMAGRLHERTAVYSRGMAQRLSLARALLHDPGVLLLDEPDTGLDPVAAADLPHLLRGDGRVERAIILTTHDLRLALRVADDVAILSGGRFVFAAPACTLTHESLQQAYDSATTAAPFV